MTNTNTLQTSKKLLPFILVGTLILVILIGFLLTMVIIRNNNQVDPRNLPTLPASQPQIFLNNNSDQFGALVVTSKMEGVKLTIDEKEVNNPDFFPYSNTPPFVVSKIPVGTHTIRASKEGYLNTTLSVEIETGKIETIDISLAPNPDLTSLKKAQIKMPVVTKEYTIEYLNFIGITQVNVSTSPYEENKQKAIQWFKSQGVNDPEGQGVEFNDLTKTYVPQN